MENQKTELKRIPRKFSGSDEDAWQYIYDLGQEVNSLKYRESAREAIYADINHRLKLLEARR